MGSSVLSLLSGPRLYRFHKDGSDEGKLYAPNQLEKCGDNIIKTISMAWSVTIYTSPFFVPYLHKKGYFCMEGAVSLIKFASAIGILLLGAYCIRGFGRYAHPRYAQFLAAVEEAQCNFTKDNKVTISKFDFEFHAWPVEFIASPTDTSRIDEGKTQSVNRRISVAEKVKTLPCKLLSFVAAHTIGRRMVYPGSVGLLQMLTSSMLIEGRAKLVEKFKGQRYKLQTREGNSVDTMFVDRRNSSHPQGKILIICCEGNAGFYEYGVMFTPLELSYSVLGWNHPGFGGSTGYPYPLEERSSIDTVIQFAINGLKYPVENIVLLAWSIGGYTASLGAALYPNIKGLILDATFDDILPLAIARMPASWKPLIVRTIRDYINLVVVDNVYKFNGPVLVYRRTNDEVICTNDSAPLQSNRGNILLYKLMQFRYPNLFSGDILDLVKDWVNADKNQQTLIWSLRHVDSGTCQAIIRSYVEKHSNVFPMAIGEDASQDLKEQLALYLVSKHLEDFDATHCVPLPSSLFHLPWNPLEN